MELPTASLYSRRYLLCSDHFEENQFLRPAERNRLVWNAVPTLFLVPNQPPKVTTGRQRPQKRLPAPEAPPLKRKKRSLQAGNLNNIHCDSDHLYSDAC